MWVGSGYVYVCGYVVVCRVACGVWAVICGCLYLYMGHGVCMRVCRGVFNFDIGHRNKKARARTLLNFTGTGPNNGSTTAILRPQRT